MRSLPEVEQPLLFVELGFKRQHTVAGRLDGRADGGLLQRLFGENDGLALAVRGRHLFDRKRLADSVVDMALAHGARHAIDFQSGLIHENASFAAH